MKNHLLYEMRLAVHPAIWLLPIALAILRLVTSGSLESALSFFEFVYPLLFPIAVISLLRREKSEHTFEVLVASPHRKTPTLLGRLLGVILPLFCAVAATVWPSSWLAILAPGVLLAMVALVTGLVWREEIGLAVALGWWAISFAASFTYMAWGHHPVGSWFVLFLLGSGLSPEAIVWRKLGQLAAAVVLLSLSLFMAEMWPRSLLFASRRDAS